MKLLLTSGGITNESIARGLDDLTNFKREDVKIGFIPTASNGEPGNKDWYINQITDLYKHSFKWIDFIDFSASGVEWEARLAECNVIYVSGGNTFHLLNEVKKHKFDVWLNKHLDNFVYVGVSAGSILATPSIKIATVEPADINYVGLQDLNALNLVNYEISPHSPELLSYETNANYAKTIKNRLYAIDDNTALYQNGNSFKVLTEGKFQEYN